MLVRLNESNQSVGMGRVLVLEVETVVHLSDSDRLFVSVVSQDHLFEIEERALVVHSLTHLDLGSPGMGRV